MKYKQEQNGPRVRTTEVERQNGMMMMIGNAAYYILFCMCEWKNISSSENKKIWPYIVLRLNYECESYLVCFYHFIPYSGYNVDICTEACGKHGATGKQ